MVNAMEVKAQVKLPERYWNCLIRISDQNVDLLRNDQTLTEIMREVVEPYLSKMPFAFKGTIVRPGENINRIRIVYVDRHSSEIHNAITPNDRLSDQMKSGISSRHDPFLEGIGEDFTDRLLHHSSVPKPTTA